MQVVLEFCFSEFLKVVEYQFIIRFCTGESWNSHEGKMQNDYEKFEFSACKFKFSILAFFFDHCISFYTQEHKVPFLQGVLNKENDFLSPEKCKALLMASIESNSVELYKLATSLPRQYFIHVFSKCVAPTSTITFTELSLLLASQFANVDLLKLHYFFVSSLAKKSVAHLQYEMKVNGRVKKLHPILISSQRGDYPSFEFVFSNLDPDKILYPRIISYCLSDSYTNSSICVAGKLQILKFIFTNHSTIDVVMKPISLFSFEKANVELLEFLISQGISPLERDVYGSTL